LEFFDREKIDEYYPGAVMIPPMNVWKLPKNKLNKRKEICDSGDYFGQPKLDGSCYVYEKTKYGKSYLFSRRVSTKTGLLVEKGDRIPHIMEHLDLIVPDKTILVMEVHYPGEKSRNVTSIMGCNAPKAIERQKNKLLQAYIHDILMYDGGSYLKVSNLDRLKSLNRNVSNSYVHPEYIHFADGVFENLDHYIDECLAAGYEGTVLKSINGLYVPTKKPAWNFVKFKIESEYDVICTGFEPPTKEYKGKTSLDIWPYWDGDEPVTKPYAKGWVGALKIGVYKQNELVDLGTVASGLTDSVLEEIKRNPDNFIGEPLLVKAMEPTEGNLREKRFIRFRDDINPHDCTWEKIFK